MNNQNFDNQNPNNMNYDPQNNNQPINLPKSTGKGFSIAALVLGIVSCILAWFYLINLTALAASIVGVILAVKGRKLAHEAGAPKGIGTAGLVLSIIGLSLSAIGFISCTICVACVADAAATSAKAFSSSWY